MRHHEIFKIYNLKHIKNNIVSISLISISILITMTISLIIPQLEVNKQQNLDTTIKESSKDDLMIVQSYQSQGFSSKLNEMIDNDIEVNQINYAPIYLNENSNSVMIYLLSGYDNIKENTIIISKNLADNYSIKIGDKVKLKNVHTTSEVIVSKIEDTPVDINDDAKVTGYIKANNIVPAYNSNTNIYFINSSNLDELQSDLKKIEPGFLYKTLEDRSNEMFQLLDIQIASLNLIGIVGYVLSISVALTGFVMIIVRCKRDIANLIILGLSRKDIMKAFKIETNMVLFIPLIISVMLSIVISNLILKSENISYLFDEQNMLRLLLFGLFNIFVFAIYRGIAISSIKTMNVLKIIKNENGMINKKFKIKLIIGVIFIPVIICSYAVLLMSGTSIMVSILLSICLILMIILLYFLISVILKFPLWKCKKASLYISKNISFKKLIYVISMVNLSLLLLFIMIGFHLGSMLHDSVEYSINKTLPYNLMMKSENVNELKQVLNESNDVSGFSVIAYSDGVIGNDNIGDKKVRINEIESDQYGAAFKLVKGDDVFSGNSNDVLISEAYSKAYKIELGDSIRIKIDGVLKEYGVKGIYDSGGINNNWMLKSSNNDFNQLILLVKSYDKKILNQVENTYVADADSIGSYIKKNTETFLNSFKYICILFTFASLVFNINLMKLMKETDKKEDSIIRVLGIGKRLIYIKECFKIMTITLLSILISTGMFFLMARAMASMFSLEKISLTMNLMLINLGISVVFIISSVVFIQDKTSNDLLILKEE